MADDKVLTSSEPEHENLLEEKIEIKTTPDAKAAAPLPTHSKLHNIIADIKEVFKHETISTD